MRTRVAVGEATVTGRQHCGVQDMRAILAEQLGERLWDEVSIEDLLHKGVVERDRRGRAIGEEPSYELRYREFGASQSGIVGHMTHGMFRDWVEFTLDNVREQLAKEQPGCEWVLVAALVDQANLRTSVPVPFTGRSDSSNAPLLSIANHNPEDVTTVYALERKTSFEERPDYRWMVRTVWADKAKGDLVDPQVALGAHPGPMTHYIEGGRQLRHLTQSMRQIRRKCEAALLEYQHRLKEQREEWADVSEAFVRRAPVSAAAEEISSAQVDAAFEMRRQGINLPLIAAAMGVDATALERLVEKKLDAILEESDGRSDTDRLDELVGRTLPPVEPEKPRSSRRKGP